MSKTVQPADLGSALLGAAFPEPVPPRLRALLGAPGIAALARFKAGPIVGERTRFFVADTGEAEAWSRRVEDAWPGAGEFLGRAPRGTRRVVDSDGETATLYLDDLQDVDHALPTPAGMTAMALRLELATGRIETLTRHEGLPALPAEWAQRAQRLAGLGDLWAVAWGPEGCCGLLVVNQERHRGLDPSGSMARVASLVDAERWGAVADVVRTAGLVPYADGVAIDRDGQVEATLGIWDPSR